jgi:hypothetical protein
MAYLDKTTVQIEAILTNKGRELLAKGVSNFNITKFAIADDEVDYRLYNQNAPATSDQYGAAIEAIPILEASANETQMLKYKLVTLNKNTARIPVLSVGQTTITLQSAGQTYIISPQTINYPNGNATFGYTAILSNSDIAEIYPAANSSINTNYLPELLSGLDAQSVAVIAHKFEIKAKQQLLSDGNATITIIGNETGGRVTLQLTVTQQPITDYRTV